MLSAKEIQDSEHSPIKDSLTPTNKFPNQRAKQKIIRQTTEQEGLNLLKHILYGSNIIGKKHKFLYKTKNKHRSQHDMASNWYCEQVLYS